MTYANDKSFPENSALRFNNRASIKTFINRIEFY